MAVDITKADIDAELARQGLEDTPENRKKVRQELIAKITGKGIGPSPITGTNTGSGKNTGPSEDTQWESMFLKIYPQYAYMFTDLDRNKYADLFQLFKESINPKTGEQIITNELFRRRFEATSYIRELETSKIARQLSAVIGNFAWGSGNLAKFLTRALNYGYKDEHFKQQAYAALFEKVNGAYTNKTGVEQARKSTPFLDLQNIGKRYFWDIDPSIIENTLAGVPGPDGLVTTKDDLLRMARVYAKSPTNYAHLSEQIDAGLTMENLAANYKTMAADILGLNPDMIDFAKDYNEALNWRKDGAPRTLTLSEWETELRTNDKYGFRFTKQANQDATNIGLMIARAFGKVQ